MLRHSNGGVAGGGGSQGRWSLIFQFEQISSFLQSLNGVLSIYLSSCGSIWSIFQGLRSKAAPSYILQKLTSDYKLFSFLKTSGVFTVWGLNTVTQQHVRYKMYKNTDREASFLDEIQTKVLKVFLLDIHSHLYCFALRFYFFKLTQPLTVSRFSYCSL